MTRHVKSHDAISADVGQGRYHDDMSTPLAESIKAWRAAHNITQTAAAQMFGLTPSYLSKIETKGFRPSLDTLDRIARVMGGTSGQLLGGPRELREPGASYDARTTLAAPADITVSGLRTRRGDVLVIAPPTAPHEGDVVVFTRGGPDEVGVLATHPATGDLAVWTLQGAGVFLDLDVVEISGVAVELKRPLK